MSDDQGEGTFGTAPDPGGTFGEAPPPKPERPRRGAGMIIGLGVGVLVVLAVIVAFLSK